MNTFSLYIVLTTTQSNFKLLKKLIEKNGRLEDFTVPVYEEET